MKWGKKRFIILIVTIAMLQIIGCSQPVQQNEVKQETQKQREAETKVEPKEEENTKEVSSKKGGEETLEKQTEEVPENETKEISLTENNGKEKKDGLQDNNPSEKEDKLEEGKKEKEAFTVERLEKEKICYTTINLNVRKGPGTSYEVVGALKTGEEAKVTGIAENGWYQILFKDKECYASNKYLVDTKEEAEAIQKAREEAKAGEQGAAIGEQQNKEVIKEVPQATKAIASGGIIMIGDSRCVQMQEAVQGGGCSWICENSKGYKWLEEVAIGWADPSVGKGTKVVFCLGVNDPENVRKYAELVNAKAAEWQQRGAVVYYVSVNPVWENPYTTKEEVENFNAVMPGLLSGVIWVDTYSTLMEQGCKIVDGLHYDAATSVNIFNMIMGRI